MSGRALLSSGTSLGSPHIAWTVLQLCFIEAWLWDDTQSSQAGWSPSIILGSQEVPGSSCFPLCLDTPFVRHPKGKADLDPVVLIVL